MSSVGTACTTQESFTNLNPDGPPAIAEVRLKESYTNAANPTTFLTRRVFGFGTFPDATADVDHDVTSASASGQSMRIIMDELLLGNRLEEIQCRGQVDADAFSSVPDGATPDDIAACSVNTDSLKTSCRGDHAVCICHIAGGCGAIAEGDPVGVLDVNNDGAADNTSFKAGAVGIKCGAIDVPIDLDMSYWNPSGDQQVPAMGGYDALGPAIVIVPQGGNVPTNSTCGLTFGPDVLDKQGNAVCAPPAGRPASCSGAIDTCQAGLECTPGDVSAFSFKTEGLRVTVLGLSQNATNVSATTAIFVTANAPIAATSIGGITITPPPPVDFTITQPMPAQIKFTPTTPLTANTMYTITFPVTVTDTFGQPLPAPYVFNFTTAP
ncbi:MAG: Ig-like domain-containing protein [Kofleriaceae bacterium]